MSVGNMDIAPSSLLLEIQEKLDDVAREEHNYVGGGVAKFAAIRDALFDRRKEVVMRVPYFWLRVLIGHPALSLFITDVDSRILSRLVDVEVMRRNARDFELVFTFASNEFFEDECLVKSFTFSERLGRVVGVHGIKWKGEKGQLLGRRAPGQGRSRFIRWIAEDAQDISHLGELIRDEVHPHAIELFFGTYSMLR